MRYLSLLCILLSSFPAMLSQNYRIINPDRDYYYHDLNHVIHIDSVEGLGSDIRYHNYELIDFCDPPQDFPKWLSHPISVDTAGVFVFQNDSSESITLQSNSQLADTWTLYTYPNGEYLEAEHIATDWQSVLGILDSVKTLSLILRDTLGTPRSSDWNGKPFLLSKNHGLIRTYNLDRFPVDTTSYQLLGLTNPKLGQPGITDREIFDFEVGDEMQYAEDYLTGSHSLQAYDRWIVLSKEIFPNSFRYEIEETRLRFLEINGQIEATMSFDTVTKAYPTPQFPKLPFEDTETDIVYWYSMNSPYGGRTIRYNNLLEPDEFLPCWQMALDIFPTFGVAGLGGNNFYTWVPWALFGSYVPIYYKKGGVEWGTPFDFSVGLAPDLTKNITLSPNPFSNNLQISFPDNLAQPVNIELYDLNGKIQLSKKLSPGTESEINTTSLPAGLYLYRITATDGRFTTGKLVKR